MCWCRSSTYVVNEGMPTLQSTAAVAWGTPRVKLRRWPERSSATLPLPRGPTKTTLCGGAGPPTKSAKQRERPPAVCCSPPIRAALVGTRVTTKEAAKRLSIPESRIRQMIARRTLYSALLDSRLRIPAFQFSPSGGLVPNIAKPGTTWRLGRWSLGMNMSTPATDAQAGCMAASSAPQVNRAICYGSMR